MDFTHETTPSGFVYIAAKGEIEAGDAARFEAYVDRFKLRHATIVLDSPGGSLVTGIEFGWIARQNRMTTFVPSNTECASACALAFFGGVQRWVQPTGRLGVHQFRWEGTELPSAEAAAMSQSTDGALVEYVVNMGLDVRAVLVGMRTPAKSMHIFSTDELEEYRIVTPDHREQAEGNDAKGD